MAIQSIGFPQDKVVNIPDSSFFKTLIAPMGLNADKNHDGKIQVSEAESIYGLHLVYIKNLTGIEAFKNLTNLSIWWCDNLDTIDVSQNKKLQTFEATYISNIKHINLKGLTELKNIQLYANTVEQIDVSTNTNLESIFIIGNLKSIDISKNTKLKVLLINSPNISCLDLSKNIQLRTLNVEYCGLNSINLKNNKLLSWLNTTSAQLRDLDLSNNTLLDTLEVGNDKLTNLNLSKNAKLSNLVIRYENANPPNFKKLNLSSLQNLKILGLLGYIYPYPIDSVCLPSLDSVDLKKIWIQTSLFNDTVIFTSGCSPDTLTEEFNIKANPPKLCLGIPTNLSIQNPDSAYSYQLIYGDGTNSSIPNLQYTYSQSGNKNIQLIADYGCYKDTAKTNVMVYATPPTSIFNDFTCTKDTFSLHAGIGYEHYNWQNGDTTESLAITKAGQYKVTASNMCGSVTDSTQVQFIKKALQINTPRTCVINESEFEVKNIQYPVLDYHWSLGNGDLFKGSKTLEEVYTYQYTQAGTYKPQLIVDYHCFSDTASTQVIVDDTPILNIGDSILICKDEEISLDAGEGFSSYLWSDGSIGQTFTVETIKVFKNLDGLGEGLATYHVTVTNSCGSQTDSITIKKVQLWLPNIITPNGDDKNEYLEIKSPLQEPVHLQILNRWGQEVYQSDNYKNDWDAKDLSDGVYYFNSHYEGCPVLKGWVQVAR